MIWCFKENLVLLVIGHHGSRKSFNPFRFYVASEATLVFFPYRSYVASQATRFILKVSELLSYSWHLFAFQALWALLIRQKGLPDVNQVNKTFFFKHRFFMHAKTLFKIKLLKKKVGPGWNLRLPKIGPERVKAVNFAREQGTAILTICGTLIHHTRCNPLMYRFLHHLNLQIIMT